MNKETALKISLDGINQLLLNLLKDSQHKLKDYNSFMALLTDLKQLFETHDYIKENLK